MSKWEDKYYEISPKIDDMIKRESVIIDILSRDKAKYINDVDSKEYRKLRDDLNYAKKEKRRLERLKPNLNKIANIIEYREDLRKQLNKLKKESEQVKDLSEVSKKKEEQENKISKYQNRYEEINKELKKLDRILSDARKKDLTPEQKKEVEDKVSEKKGKLEGERAKILEEMPKAQDERDKQEELLRKSLGKKTTSLSKEEIDKKSFDIQNKISKCNFVARNLLEGLSWDSIDMKLDSWKDKKFTAKDDKLSKAKDNAKKDEEKEPEKDNKEGPEKNSAEGPNKDSEQPAIKPETELGDNGINPELPTTTFADRHPRLAKIGKFFSKIKNVFSRSRKSNEEKAKTVEELQDEMQKEEIAKTVEEIIDEKSKQKGEKTQEEIPFKEYIKQIAEKGMSEVKKEKAREKLAKMQEVNREAEEKKYGKAYADMSRTDDGSR